MRAAGGERSGIIRARVIAARGRQAERYEDVSGVRCNGDASGRLIQMRCELTAAARELLDTAAERLSLSARSYHRTLRVARTIADLDGEEALQPNAVAEALSFRPEEWG